MKTSDQPLNAKVLPRALLLELLLANDGQPLLVSHAVAAGALFDISANHLRVALARLSAQSLVQAAGRGAWVLGPAARELAHDVARWRGAAQRMRVDNGQYVAVHCAHLGRGDRTQIRQRERALRMLGFAPLHRDLWLRPDNIEADVAAVRARLYTLGLESDALVCGCHDLDAATQVRVRQLWDASALDAGYRKTIDRLQAWQRQAPQLAIDRAARESFLLGSAAIRQLVYDPLLPASWVDAPLRSRFIAAVQDFDATGRALWLRLFDSLPASQARTAAHARAA